jgi:3-oxosteroid 1-dehydrogenase
VNVARMTDEVDFVVDFLVVGSGAGGLAAAITAHHNGLRTAVIEKAATYGGTTALSGGVLWVPNNPLMAAAGLDDSPDAALDYWKHTVGDDVVPELRDAYLQTGPGVIEFLLRHSPLRMMLNDLPDYCAQLPGGRLAGRSVEAAPARRDEFGELLDQLRPSYFEVPGNMMVTMEEGARLTLVATSVRHAAWSAGLLARHLITRLLRPGAVRLTTGQALVAYLRLGLHQRDIPLRLNTRVVELLTDRGRVTGVVVEDRHGARRTITARRGVLLTAGGFAHSTPTRDLAQPATGGGRWSAAPGDDTGDALDLAAPIGAARALMDESWWMLVTVVDGHPPYLAAFERFKPGFVMVDGTGQRYVNEADPYQLVGRAMIDRHTAATPTIPSWFVMDSRYLRRYAFGPSLPPGPRRRHIRNGYLTRADTIEELATLIGIDPDTLGGTVERHNRYAQTGHDPEFGRGDNPFDRAYGDPACTPNPCLRAIERAPFYAARIYPGDIGTKGGLVTDEHARVLTETGEPIPGLYAAGNSAASVMGHHYPGAGATIGPSVIFGYLAAKHAVGGDTGSHR